MSNPLDTNSYKFYLNFVNSFGVIEITEPVKFDGSTIVLEQDDQRYGRDVSFMNEGLDLFFYKGSYDVTSNPLMMPNGTIYYNLTQGFEQLLEEYKINGFEAEIEFIIEKDNVQFITGVLDFKNAQTDQLTYISCKVINNTSKQIVKRREEFVVDMFSDEDVDGNYIEPLTTTDILLKAKPVVQSSKWKNSEPFWAYTYSGVSNIFYQNPLNLVLESGIERTLSYLDRFIYTLIDSLEDDFYDFGYIDADEDLTGITLELTSVKLSYFINTAETFDENWSTIDETIFIQGNAFDIGDRSFANSENVLFKRFYNPNTNTIASRDEYVIEYIGVESIDRFQGFTGNAKRYDVTLPDTTLNVDAISRDKRLAILFNVGRQDNIVEWLGGDIKITATSTAIDTVIKGARWIDIIKQNVKSISGLDVYAPKIDNGGEFYDNFVFTGNLIKRRDDVAFPVKFKDLINTITEHNGDYQILNDKIYFNTYNNFYPNYEIGAFLTPPNKDAKSYFNDRYTINLFEYGYKVYEQDKDVSNTIDAVHTQSQWSLDNKQVENVKKIELDQVRDPFKIEFARELAAQSTTSTDDEDKLFLIDVVPLAPSTRGGFTSFMFHQVDGSELKLLKDAELPSWAVLGFGVGDTFTVENTVNAGDYTVTEIEDAIITLNGSPSASVTLGILTEVSYAYTNVAFTNRTNEGFDVIENVLNPDKFSNLLYTIKRNMSHWLSYLKTASKYKPNGTLRNRYFRNNGKLETKYTGETSITTEDADILNVELTDALIEPKLYETTLIVPYSDMIDTFNLVNNINGDDSIGGFIRVINTNNRVLKLYPTKMEYNPSTETMQLTGEERYEDEIVTITSENGLIYIQEVGYDINTGYQWYEIDNGYLQLFDNNNLPIINPTRYDFVIINGENSVNQEELSNKLIQIN